MKIFKITNPDEEEYDQYRSAVVIASNEDEARLMHPDTSHYWATGSGWIKLYYGWKAEQEELQQALEDSISGKLIVPGDLKSTWRDDKDRLWEGCLDCWPSDPNTVIVELLGEAIGGNRLVVVADYNQS